MKYLNRALLVLMLILALAISTAVSCGDDDDDDDNDSGGIWTCCFAICEDGELVWDNEPGDVTSSEDATQSVAQKCSDHDGPDTISCLVCDTDVCTSCAPDWWVEGYDVDDDVDDDADDDVDDDSADDDVNDDVDDDVEDCDLSSNPVFGTWTPDFDPQTDCSCDVSNTDCHSLYVGRVDEIDGNTATLSFQKTGGGGPSVDVNYWVVVSDVEPDCNLLDVYVVRSSGTWMSTEAMLTINVPVWPDLNSCEVAPAGAIKNLFIITGGADGATTKTWFQKQWLTFTRN
jgi:hypothetical protein